MTEQLRIDSIGYSPDGIARLEDGRVCFVPQTVSGDLVEVKITSEHKNYCKGEVVKILEPSEKRVTPKVNPALFITGCPWAHINYNDQRIYKRRSVIDSLVRIGHFNTERAESLVRETLSPSDEWGYRNKLELNFGVAPNGKAILGMMQPDTNSLVKIDSCELLPKKYTKIPKALTGSLSYLANSYGLSFDRVGVRASVRTNEIEIALWGEPGSFPRAQVARVLQDACKNTSIVRVLQKGPKKARRVTGVERLSGAGKWSESLANNTMHLSAPSFFQVNTKGAEALVHCVLEALDPQETDIAMDLYCGAGTFTLPLAQRVNYVQAVESYGPAVRDLRRNLEQHQLFNVDAIGGDAALEFPDEPADIIVVDPPRAGLAEEVVDLLSHQKARAIAYVSCDPATLARDLARFEERGIFAPQWIQPVDLFPQTYHIETVCLLTRKDVAR